MRGRAAMPSGSTTRIASASALEMVIALPFSFSDRGAIIGVRSPDKPRFTAIGKGPSMWAPSSAPMATLSRILAQEASRLSSTLRPSPAKKPFSWATARGAQSLRAMKPMRRGPRTVISIPP